MASEANEPGSESGKRSDERRGVPEGTPQEGGASTPLAAPGSFAAAAMIYPDGLLVSRPPRRAAARPGRLIGRVVDPQAAALQVGAVELLLGALGVLGARHGDEPEAPRLTRVAVGDDRHRLAGARLREQLAQLVLRHPVGEVADEELLRHLGPLLISASQRLQCGRRCAMTPRPWR